MRFACHHLTVVFCPITKFAAGHKSSPNLYFVIPIRSPPMRVQPLNRVIIAFGCVRLAVDINSPYAEAFCQFARKLYSVSPSHLRPKMIGGTGRILSFVRFRKASELRRKMGLQSLVSKRLYFAATRWHVGYNRPSLSCLFAWITQLGVLTGM